MKILAIETSCDETAAAVTEGLRVLSNVIFSQIDIHKKWGGVFPSLAKRAHEEKIDQVIDKALKNARVKMGEIDAVAVTFGPGLVIALEVGLRKAKELALKHQKLLIPVNHLEGHIYSVFVQNRSGRPGRKIKFPFISLIVSGGHTSLLKVNDHLRYEVLGKTIDDAAGEALDKAAKMLGLGYPGGPIIESLASQGNSRYLELPVPLKGKKTSNFSYSGLKTAFKYQVEAMTKKEVVTHLPDLAASFQEAVFAQIIDRLERLAFKKGLVILTVGGGVVANKRLRRNLRAWGKQNKVEVLLPFLDKLIGDNAAMIGVAAYFKYKKGVFLKDNFDRLDRVARPDLSFWTKVEG